MLLQYRCSDFVQRATDERLILHGLFAREDAAAAEAAPAGGVGGGVGSGQGLGFNVLVDLCGIFKKISIPQVRDPDPNPSRSPSPTSPNLALVLALALTPSPSRNPRPGARPGARALWPRSLPVRLPHRPGASP